MKKRSTFLGILKLFEVLHEHDTTASELRHIYDAFVVQNELTPEENKLSKEEYAMLEAVNNLFVKPAKKERKIVYIDMLKVREYRNTFPDMKLPSDKYARNNEKELAEAFGKFFLKFPEFFDWDLVLIAAQRYVTEYEQKGYMYMRTSKYFISKTQKDKSIEYELANYCQQVIEGTGEPTAIHFTEKIV